jgi:Dyp-type peroxidase family
MAVNSKHLRSTTELSLIANIKPGLVDIGEPTAHSARLRAVLRVLSGFSEAAAEGAPTLVPGVLERLHMLHFFNWSLIDGDRRLLLTVVFDGPWETYIRAIVEDAGPFLDLIFCHCEGYAGNACFDGYAKFSAWVRKWQIGSDFLYAGAPDLTSDDLVYLREFEHRANRGVSAAGRLVPSEAAPVPDGALLGRKLLALSALRAFFPSNGQMASGNDLLVLHRAAEFLTRADRVNGNIAQLPPPLREWLKELVEIAPPRQLEPVTAALTERDRAQIQGNVIEGYEHQHQPPTHGCLLLVTFRDRAAAVAFLEDVKPRLAVATLTVERERKPQLNLAITFAGLKAAGLAPELLAQFPEEFQEGLESRAGLLGDVGLNHPSQWRKPLWNWPEAADNAARLQLTSIDALVTVQGWCDPSDAGDHEWSHNPLRRPVEDLCQRWEALGVRVLHVQSLRRHERSHFGFVDGISQPKLRTPDRPLNAKAKYDESVAPGEILLGYPNERGEVFGDPASPLWRNSTFLVVRKMSQDVARFEKAELRDGAVAAQLLGRHPEGDPLLPGGDTRNDFDYRDDGDGQKCPLYAHVRRSNPRRREDVDGRTIRTPRIIRRGFSYGPPVKDGADATPRERGLIFMAHAASIAEQYEIIQRWINGGNSTGDFSGNPDIIAGTFPPNSGRRLRSSAGGEARELPVPALPLVKLEWGLYAFVPSLEAVAYLARVGLEPAATRGSAPQLRAPAIVADLQKLDMPVDGENAAQAAERHALATAGWKRVLEEPSLGAAARVIWGFVRARGGALRTPYGVLVGSSQGVLDVLGDASRFSACEYWRRMENSLGGLYLGLDPKPITSNGARSASRYERESTLPNQYIASIEFHRVFAQARDFARDELKRRKAAVGMPWDLRDLVGAVVAQVAREWFGVPDFATLMTDAPERPPTFAASRPPQSPDELLPARCPVDFQRISQYVFHPNPTPVLEQDAVRRGASAREAGDRFVRQRPRPSPLLDYLDQHDYPGDRSAAVLGALNGFSAPTAANCAGVLFQWAESGALQRWQGWYASESRQHEPEQGLTASGASLPDSRHPLVADVLSRMMARSIPDLLHRTATREAQLAPDVTVTPGERIVVSLGSAAEDGRASDLADYWTLLFGGQRLTAGHPAHACPGQQMALGTILGVAIAVLGERGLVRQAPFLLKFQAPEVLATTSVR